MTERAHTNALLHTQPPTHNGPRAHLQPLANTYNRSHNAPRAWRTPGLSTPRRRSVRGPCIHMGHAHTHTYKHTFACVCLHSWLPTEIYSCLAACLQHLPTYLTYITCVPFAAGTAARPRTRKTWPPCVAMPSAKKRIASRQSIPLSVIPSHASRAQKGNETSGKLRSTQTSDSCTHFNARTQT